MNAVRFLTFRPARAGLALLTAVGLFAAATPSAIPQGIDLKAVQQPLDKKKSKYGPYVGVFGGQSYHQDAGLKIDYAGHSLNYDVLDHDGDAMFGLEVGYAWRTKYLVEFALEFEAFFSTSQINAAISNRGNEEAPIAASDIASIEVDVNYAAFMLNGSIALDLRRFKPHIGNFLPRFRPYVGGGIGGAQLWYRNQRLQTVGDVFGTPTGPSASPFSVDEFVLAYQFYGGLEATVTDKLSAFIEYRRFSLVKTEDLSDFSSEFLSGGLHIKY
jgi:opacity protein-like surface antigen